MNQLFGLALGGSCGAILRFLVSTGVYQWLGRDFPYGTLAVNLIGSFLLGLLTEALLLQRVALALEYRTAILVGFIGAFTTFSTFALETVVLLEQGHFTKALLNVCISVMACLLVVWLGLWCGRFLFSQATNVGLVVWQGWPVPYAMIVVNILVAFLITVITTVLLQKTTLVDEYIAAILIITVGTYLTLSGLYLTLHLIEQGLSFIQQGKIILTILATNTLICFLVMGLTFCLIVKLT